MVLPPIKAHCIHPALAPRDTFLSVLPLPAAVGPSLALPSAASVPLPMALPGAEPRGLLPCATMPWPPRPGACVLCAVKTACSFFHPSFLFKHLPSPSMLRRNLSWPQVPARLTVGPCRPSLREGSGFQVVFAACSVLLPACTWLPAAAWPVDAFPQLSEARQGMKHYPFPDVCSEMGWNFCSSPLNTTPWWGTTHLSPDSTGNASRHRSVERG